MKRQVLAAALIMLFGIGAARGQERDSLTLDAAIQTVLSGHPLIRQAMEEIQASSARVDQGKTKNLPFSDLDLSYERLGPVPELDFLGAPFKLYPENNYDAHVTLRQTVYDFGKTRASVEASEAAVQAAADNVDLIKSNLIYQTANTFYAILFLQRSITIQQQQIDALNGHLDLARKRVESGSATDYDIISTRVRVAAAENQKVDYQTDLNKAETSFRRLLGLPAGAAPALKGSFEPDSFALDSDSLTALAQKQRPEVRQARDAVRSAELQKNIVSLQDKPSLNFNFMYGFKNGFIPNLDVFRGNFAAGLAAAIPIYNGSLTGYQEQEAEANIRGTQSRTTDAERMVAAEVQQAVSDVRANRTKLATAQLQIDQAQQALDMARVRYQSGIITNLDLIDAETALEEAQLSHLRTVYQLVLSRYTLDRAVGK